MCMDKRGCCLLGEEAVVLVGVSMWEGKVRGHQRGVCEGVCGYHKVILGCVRTVQWLN